MLPIQSGRGPSWVAYTIHRRVQRDAHVFIKRGTFVGASWRKATPFMNSHYFTIPEICDDVIRDVQNANVESLDQYLVSPSESTYKACAPSEQF